MEPENQRLLNVDARYLVLFNVALCNVYIHSFECICTLFFHFSLLLCIDCVSVIYIADFFADVSHLIIQSEESLTEQAALCRIARLYLSIVTDLLA